MRAPALWIALIALSACVGCGSEVAAPPEHQGDQLALPTSDWEQGDEMMFAGITGVLHSDAQGCVTLGHARTPAVWPKGFTAFRHDGQVTLYGPEGEVVATEGETLQVGGGGAPVEPSASLGTCAPPSGDVWLVQGDVQVVRD